MRRRYKILLIIIVGIILTILINNIKVTNKTNLTALGDGFSKGMTPYKVAGSSFNDYLKEKLENKENIGEYNTEFSQEYLRIHELNEYLITNKIGSYTKTPIKQIIAKTDLLTISIGQDEFMENSQIDNIKTEQIDKYLQEIAKLLTNIREFYNKDIILIGLYPFNNFSNNDAIEINSKLKIICGKYDISFIDIMGISLNKEYYLEKNNYYMNYLAHEKIAKLIYVMYRN